MNTLAAYDALDLAGLSLLAAKTGRAAKAKELHIEASVAALNAFPEDSEAAKALVVVLNEVGLAAAFAGLEATP